MAVKEQETNIVKYLKSYIKLLNDFRLYSDKSIAVTFESHLNRLEEDIKTLLLDLQKFIKSFGLDIIEDIRPHRIAYAKSLTFRIFLDIKPENDCLIVSIRKGRTQPVIVHTIRNMQESESIKPQIKDAYNTIK
jgi:hypothetical protein